MQKREYKFTLTEENKSKVEQFLKLLNIDADIVEAENTKEVQEKEWPQDGDKYYFILSEGLIDDAYFIDGDELASEHRLAVGNCFKTSEEAEFELERLKVLAEMRKFAESEDCEWDGENTHWYVYYDYECGYISYCYNIANKSNRIYFESSYKAQECVKAVGKDRIKKYYLRIKE